MESSYEAIVVGGGLAGLSAALNLAQNGVKVALLEARPQLGGRTSSWVKDGMEVESGLHRCLGFYTAFPRLLRQAGLSMDSVVVWENELEVRLPDGGPRAEFGASLVFHPLKTLATSMGNGHFLTWEDKLSLAKFFARGLADYSWKPQSLDEKTVHDFAQETGLTPAAYERVIIPLTEGIFFLPPEQYSALNLFGLIGPYLGQLHRTRVGAFRGGMTEVMANPLGEAVARAGGDVWVDAPVERLLVKEGRVEGVVLPGSFEVRAPVTILAASLGAAKVLAQGQAEELPWLHDSLQKLPSMSAATVQFELASPALPVDRVTFGPRTSLTSFSEQSRTTFSHKSGRLSCILSPADKFIAMSDEEVAQWAIKEAARLGIRLEGHIIQKRCVHEPHEFYSLAPGHDSLRPSQATPIPGLVLAGDYTRQKYLATMEGAVVSGELAFRVAAMHLRRALDRRLDEERKKSLDPEGLPLPGLQSGR